MISKISSLIIRAPDTSPACTDLNPIASSSTSDERIQFSESHGGMFNYEGGLIGAGSARVPMECFEKAMETYVKRYGGDCEPI